MKERGGLRGRAAAVPCGGFTLLEVMVSLLLLAILSLVILESYRAGLGIWERERADEITLGTARILMDKITSQIKSAYPWGYRKEGRAPALYFKGEEESIQFASLVGITSRRSGLVHVLRWSLETGGEGGKRLRIEEYSWPRREFPEGEEPLFSEVVEGVESFALGYQVEKKSAAGAGEARRGPGQVAGGTGEASPTGTVSRWTSSWPLEGEGAGETLTAVSVSIKMRNGDESAEEFKAVIPVLKQWQGIEG